MTKLIHFFKQFDIPVSTHSFALFRILYASYVLGLIFQLYLKWPFYFDHITPFSYSLFPVKLGLLCWALANFGIALGFFTRFSALVNYVFVVLMAAYFPNIHIPSFNDDLLRIGGFILLLMPVSRSFSVDAVLSRINLKQQQHTTSYLNYLFVLLISIGLLYLGSGITKVFSPMWQKGIGLWVPAVIPSYKWNTFSFFVDQQWIMYTLNYLVIVFELVFPFLLFYKRSHAIIACLGIGFHLGIALLFPFSYISFGPILYYVLFIPQGWWSQMKPASVKTTIVYNPNQPKHLHAIGLLQSIDQRQSYIYRSDETVPSLQLGQLFGWEGLIALSQKHLLGFPLSICLRNPNIRLIAAYASENWLTQTKQVFTFNRQQYQFNRFVWYVFVAGLCCIQLLTSAYHTSTTLRADKGRLAIYLKKRMALQDFSTKPSNLARTFFGINSRGVFLDHAFTGVKTVYSIALLQPDGTEKWLPLFTKEGYCTGENIGLGWHKLSFSYFAQTTTQPDTNGLKKYTWYWAQRQLISPNQLTFKLYRKIYPCATAYEHGYLQKMLALPWDTMGIIHWNDSVFSFQNLKPDSSLIQ